MPMAVPKDFIKINLVAQNHMLYNNIFISQRNTKECVVYRRLNGRVSFSGKAKITVQDSTTKLYLHDT